jgi:hypothetical protein
MAGVVAGAGVGFHWMSLKTQRGSSETRRYLEKNCKETDDHHLRRAPARLPSASSLALRLLLLLAMKFFGSTSTEGGKLRLAKAWKVEDLVKG